MVSKNKLSSLLPLIGNAGLNSAVQAATPSVPAVPNPPWVAPPVGQSADRLGYDGAGRMISKRYTTTASGNPVLVGFTTAFDRASNKLYERALHAESRSNLYEPFDPATNLPQGDYDSLDRLLQYQRGVLNSTGGDGGNGGGSVGTAIAVANTNTQRSYQLDGLGNWRNTTFTPAGGSSQTEVRQHNGLNQITRLKNPAAGELVDPTYDLNGNLTNDGSRLFYWDALNRLCEVDKITGTEPLSWTEIAKYFYDAFNRRIEKIVYGGGYSDGVPAGTTDCIYSGWRCVEDRSPSDDTDTLLVQYVWGRYLDELLQMQTYLDSTGPEGLAAGVYYPLQDLLYRNTALTNPSGGIVEPYDTDAYGNTLIFSAVGTSSTWWDDDAVQAAYPACPYVFTGQRFDAETCLYYYKRRYYWPAWGRFLSEDPKLSDLNHYANCRNNPLRFSDPFGEAVSLAKAEDFGDALLGKLTECPREIKLPQAMQDVLKKTYEMSKNRPGFECGGEVTAVGSAISIWGPIQGGRYDTDHAASVDILDVMNTNPTANYQGLYHLHTFQSTVFSKGDVAKFLIERREKGDARFPTTKNSFSILLNKDCSVIRAMVALGGDERTATKRIADTRDLKNRIQRDPQDQIKDWGGYTGYSLVGSTDPKDVYKDDERLAKFSKIYKFCYYRGDGISKPLTLVPTGEAK